MANDMNYSSNEVQIWLEQESSIHLRAIDGKDPVELTADGAREIGEALIRLAV